jgi:hypothetical protein
VLIGQTYTPTSDYFYSSSAINDDGNLLGIGQFYVGRKPMIRLTFGDLKLAFVEPNTESYTIPGNGNTIDPYGKTVSNYDTDATFPKIELSYGYKGEMFFVDVFGGYQTYEIELQSGPSEDVDAYVAGIGAGVNVGPAFLKAGFHIGQNFGNYGQYNQAADFYFADDCFNDKATFDQYGQLEDSDGMGYLAVLGFTANDMLTFEAGYGYEKTELDALNYEAEVAQYYLNATIHIHKNFFVVPEVGMVEYEEDGAGRKYKGEPEFFYAGAKWQINF